MRLTVSQLTLKNENGKFAKGSLREQALAVIDHFHGEASAIGLSWFIGCLAEYAARMAASEWSQPLEHAKWTAVYESLHAAMMRAEKERL